jgi:hypothetical protein
MTRLNVNDARCVALFASGLQRSDAPAAELAEVIGCTVRRLGIAGCASRMAQEFGDHPDTAAARMRWIRQLVADASAPSAPSAPPAAQPARPRAWPPASGSGRRAAAASVVSPAA